MFSARFDTLLNTLSIKNIDISRKLFVDRSLISRWRSGSREPKNEEIAEIADAVIEACTEMDKQVSLCQVLKVSYDPMLFQETKTLTHILKKWLSDSGPDEKPKGIDWEKEPVAGMLQPVQFNLFAGFDGYRYCFKTILDMAIWRGKPFQFNFVGDDGLKWLTERQDFSTYLNQAFKKAMGTGIRVRIVVRISNTTWKMENYVRLWSLAQQIPETEVNGLYGLVNGEENRRLYSHAVLSIPEVGSMMGWSVKNSLHQYVSLITDPAVASHMCEDFDFLFSGCIPLTREIKDFSYGKMFALINNDLFRDVYREYLSHSFSLPLFSLPEKTFFEMCKRAGIEEGCAGGLLDIHRELRKWFISYVQKGILEFFYVDRGWNEKTVLHQSFSLFGVKLTYTEDEYLQHLRAALKDAGTYINFHFYPIEKALYPSDIHLAYETFFLSYSHPWLQQVTVSTHQHFVSCVFSYIKTASRKLPGELSEIKKVKEKYLARYPKLTEI